MPDSSTKAPAHTEDAAHARLDGLAFDLSHEWSHVTSDRLGPFVTRATLRHREGAAYTWTSRSWRKHHSLLDTGRGSTWWAPGAVGWWIGILFAVGSICFALGAAPGYLSAVGNEADAITFFIGSLWFTSAALLQYWEAVNVCRTLPEPVAQQHFRLVTWEPRRIDWWSTAVQFAGTLFFNISTFSALLANLSVNQIDRLVWTPDVYGSACFLIASGLAWIEVCRSFLCWRSHEFSWWITALNLTGSVAFGISAAAAFVVPTAGSPINITLVNLGTFVGALCFLVGAVLLLPERTHDPPS